MTDPNQPAGLPALLAERARVAPDAAAIRAPGRGDLSYGELLALTERTADRLAAFGIASGDRVALVLPNGPEAATAFLGVAGWTTCAPLNPAYRAPEYEFYLSDLGARALIVQRGMESDAIGVAREHGMAVIELVPQADGPAGTFELVGQEGAPANGRRAPANGRAAGADDVALVLHTSGTTSRPKIVPLTHGNVCASAHNIARTLRLTPADGCLNVMPLFHVHGLMAAVLGTLAAGGSVVCTPGFDAARFLGCMEEFAPTWYTAVPTMHQAALAQAAQAGAEAARSLRFIRSCSASLAPRDMARLEETFGVPVVEAYGMTEAAHQMSCNPLPPGRQKPGSVGPAAGPEVAVMDADGNLLATGDTGEVVIRGANVTSGYEGNPEANAASFTNGWFRTGDQGVMDDEGYLRLTGRLKEIINRGGEKVSPREVDEVLMAHPAVAQAVTFAVPHPALGEDIAAAVVAAPGQVADPESIRAFAAERLAEVKLPRRVLVVDAIPKGPTGKLQRIGLHEQLADLLNADFVAPSGETEERMAAIWCEVLGVDRVGANDDFFALGGTSIAVVRLLARVAGELSVVLSPEDVTLRPTATELAQLAQTVAEDEHGNDARWPAYVQYNPAGSGPPLCVVSLGLAWEARDLARHLGPEYPVLGLRPSPLWAAEGVPATADGLAERYLAELRKAQPHGPYMLAGGCATGIVAFEMAQRLVSEGECVPLLALFDVDFPLPRIVPTPLAVLLLRAPRELARLRRMPWGARLARVRERGADWMRRLLPFVSPRTTSEAVSGPSMDFSPAARVGVWRYRPAPFPGRIAAFLATGTATWGIHDRRLPWRRVALGGWEVHPVPGDHETSLAEPHVGELAEALRDCIDRAGATL